jgi:hypothetical protein
MSDSELDPSIAALLAKRESLNADASVTEKMASEEESVSPARTNDVDLSVKAFEPVTKFFEDTSSGIFDDTSYYKTSLTGEGQFAQRVHTVLSKYLTCKDPKDKTVYRQQLVTAYWDLAGSIAPKMADLSTPLAKRMLLRFGILLPSLFTQEQKELFSKIIMENTTGEPVYYLDEWFKEITSGRIKISMTDETRPAHKATGAEGATAEQQRLMELQSKNSGKLQSSESQVKIKETERAMLESELRSRIDQLMEHLPITGFEPHRMPYSEGQRKLFGEIGERLHSLSKNDKELTLCLKEFQEAKKSYDSVEDKLRGGPAVIEVNKTDLNTEITTVRQMAKMTIGRQGNQFPIFSREFYHCLPKGTGFRENIISLLAWVESIDPGAFCRIHKNVPYRIVPYVLLIPTYGDFGFCWEPFDRYNRITSRGRIVIPMYPRDLTISVLRAVADLRWQVAKEKASYYWMEEGITGQYYQWIDSQKLKGDLKSFFVEDYILWMTKEASGVQRLDKEVRSIFWRFMPFPQSLKEELKKRSLVYAELCQKDMNRAMSDGY